MKHHVFSNRSKQNLLPVHSDLQKVAARALFLTTVDFVVICGMRTKQEQEKLVAMGKSTTMNSRHLTGHAIDAVPIIGGKIPWKDRAKFDAVAKAFKQAAKELNVPLQWGGDWKSFVDCPHYQLPWKQYPKAAPQKVEYAKPELKCFPPRNRNRLAALSE